MGDPLSLFHWQKFYHPKKNYVQNPWKDLSLLPPPAHPKKHTEHVHVDLPPTEIAPVGTRDSPGALWRRSQGKEGKRSDHPREERGRRKVSIQLNLI